MAILRLSNAARAKMCDDQLFLKRVDTAVRGTAKYHIDYKTDTVQKYNEAVRKRKQFARTIVKSSMMPNLQAYAKYLVFEYTYDSKAGPDLDENDQLSDAVISDSAASAATFDCFADIQPGDENKAIEL